MALAILDGTQTATTLSTILSSGQHITAHTVVSLGTQAITDILNATSAGLTNTQLRASAVTIGGTVTVGNSLTISSLPAISGTVTVGALPSLENNTDFVTVGAQIAEGINTELGVYVRVEPSNPLPISGTVTVGNTVTIAGTVTANPTGTQTIAGSVTISAGTAQIGSVTASISNSVTIGSLPPISGTVTVGNSVTISSLPALVAGTAQIGSVTASISNSVTIASLPSISGTVTANVFGLEQITELPSLIPVMYFADPIGDSSIGNIVPIQITNQNGTVDGNNPLPISGTVTANTFALQGTAVTTSNFTSTTASTVLANYNATREVLTIFNEGAGNLHICAGATCTTIAYQVRLSSGDYYEVPNHQTTITHSAVFATAGTARIVQIS